MEHLENVDKNIADFKPEIAKPKLTAQDIVDMSESEGKVTNDGQEAQKMVRDLRFITAILLGKKKNKELAQILDTDKSYASKQIKNLEEKGLITKEVSGREVSYHVDAFNVLKFLSAKVVIKIKIPKKEVASESKVAETNSEEAANKDKKNS